MCYTNNFDVFAKMTLWALLSIIDNAHKDKKLETEVPWKSVPHWIKNVLIVFHIKIHEISPGAIQKINVLNVSWVYISNRKKIPGKIRFSWDYI